MYMSTIMLEHGADLEHIVRHSSSTLHGDWKEFAGNFKSIKCELWQHQVSLPLSSSLNFEHFESYAQFCIKTDFNPTKEGFTPIYFANLHLQTALIVSARKKKLFAEALVALSPAL